MNLKEKIQSSYKTIKKAAQITAAIATPFFFASCQEDMPPRKSYIAENVHVHYAKNSQDTIGATVLFHDARDTTKQGYMTVGGNLAVDYARLEKNDRFVLPGPYGDIVFHGTMDDFFPHMNKRLTPPSIEDLE